MTLTKEEAIRLLTSGLGKEILVAARGYVSPIFWGLPRHAGRKPTINHGCIFFINSGKGPLAVTAEHVYAAYLKAKDESPEIICQIGNLTFVPEERLIDSDSTIDLATFRIDEREAKQIGKIVHHHPRPHWPPVRPEIGKGVFFVGFPCSRREYRDASSNDFDAYSGMLVADKVDERSVVCQFGRENWIDLFGSGFPPENEWLGGISGAPLWMVTQSPVVMAWQLAGVVVEFNQAFELLTARRPTFICEDGTLIR